MAKSVVIEGSVTPAAGVLARGQRATVALTGYIEDLIARGYVVLVEVVDEYEDEYPEPVPSEPGPQADQQEWLDFLDSKGISVPLDDNDNPPGVSGLRLLWQQVIGGY